MKYKLKVFKDNLLRTNVGFFFVITASDFLLLGNE